MKCKIVHARSRNEKNEIAKQFVACLDAVCGTALRQFGWGRERLQQMYDITQRNLSDVMITSTAADTTKEIDVDYDDAEGLIDTAETALWVMKRELQVCGYDFFKEDSALMWQDPYRSKWMPPRMKDIHAARLQWCTNTEFMTKVFIINVLVYARSKGFGAERLSKLHGMIRAGYNRFVERWLLCVTDSDVIALKEVTAQLNELNRLGLELIDLE